MLPIFLYSIKCALVSNYILLYDVYVYYDACSSMQHCCQVCVASKLPNGGNFTAQWSQKCHMWSVSVSISPELGDTC